MPTEIYSDLQEHPDQRPLRLRPGELATYHHHEGEVEYLLGVYCLKDDSRTDLLRARASDISEIPKRKARNIEKPLITRGYKEAGILSGNEVKSEFRTPDGRLVRLLIKHVREHYLPGQSPEEFAA
jgi:hypothetical protein